MQFMKPSENSSCISDVQPTDLRGQNFPTRYSSPRHSATGPLVVPLTNDYLFRALLQKNNKVLRGLICSLLHLSLKDVHTAVITNPIELGTTIDDKTFILDIKVSLNDDTLINLEMQVINEHNWPERSLSYLCRSFDSLKSGELYQNVRPVIQIGILNFTLLPDHPEFYATYKLLNVKTYTLYSDKLRLSVLDLTQQNLATEEDRYYQIDYWASLFKAVTWEEMNMLAQENEYIEEAAETVYQLSQEEKIRQQCEAREDYYRTQRGIQLMLENQKKIIAENEKVIAENEKVIAENEKVIAKNEKILKEKEKVLKEKDTEIAALHAEIAALRTKSGAEIQ